MIVEYILAYIDISIPRLYAPTLMQKMKEMTQSIFHFSIMNFNFFSPLCKFYNAVLPATFGNVNVVYVALEHIHTQG